MRLAVVHTLGVVSVDHGMAITRKQALKMLRGKIPELEFHITRIVANPHDLSLRKWKNEVLGWLRQMEKVLPHVGKKTGAEWQARIDVYRAALEGAAPAE